MKPNEHKYLQLASSIEQMIQEEVLRIGDKLPSVRVLSKKHGISPSTIFQAYYHLESKGLIEARPQSGYYVRFNKKRQPATPTPSNPDTNIRDVGMQEMVETLFQQMPMQEVVNLSLVTPSFELLPAAKLNKSVMQALTTPGHCILYDDPQGSTSLRNELVKLSFNWNGQIRTEDIVTTAGCIEALTLCLKTVTKPGDTIALESPTYFGFFQLCETLGLKVIEIASFSEFGIDLNELEFAIKKHKIKACIVMSNFSNPSGSCMPDKNKKALVEMATRHQVPLIEDDIYGEIYFGKQRPKTCKTYDREGWVMYCSSFSKSVSPGYRVGWCLPGRFTAALKKLKLSQAISGTSLTQQAMALFLSQGRYDYHLRNFRKSIHIQALKYTQAIIDNFPQDIRISRPEGGFVLWLELDKKVDTLQLYKEAIKHQVTIAPGQLFSMQTKYSNCLRISYGNRFDTKVEKGLQVLGKLIKKAGNAAS